MAITHVDSVASAGNPTTGFTLTIPDSAEVNDIIILAVFNRDAAKLPSVTNAADDSLSSVGSKDKGGTKFGLSVWWARVDGDAYAANGTITIAGCTGSCCGGLSLYRGVKSFGDPFENVIGEFNASGNETMVGVTPTFGGSLVCIVVGTANDYVASDVAATDPSSLTVRFAAISTGGSDCACTHASDVQSTMEASGNITWAQTNAGGTSLAFNLIHSMVGIGADTVELTISGIDAILTRKVTAEFGELTAAGIDTGLLSARLTSVDSSESTVAGIDGELAVARLITVDSGESTVDGIDTSIIASRSIAGDMGEHTVTGEDAELTYIPGEEESEPESIPVVGGGWSGWQLRKTSSWINDTIINEDDDEVVELITILVQIMEEPWVHSLVA